MSLIYHKMRMSLVCTRRIMGVYSISQRYNLSICKARENSNFLKMGKIVISVKIRNFSRSRMMKRTSLLESSREI